MLYELIKKTVVNQRPFPCNYCNHGWAVYSEKEEIVDCKKDCRLYADYLEGKVVVPEGFSEVRKVSKEKLRI